MLFLKRIALLTASFFMLSGGALGCHVQQPANSQTDKPAPTIEKQQPKPGELKVLAEGSQSAITNPFVAVVRDAETYAALVKLDGNLPKLDEEFFQSNAVIAAFLGERNTGGYSVEINREGAGGFRVSEKKPGKDMMVTQMITSPFKVVAIDGGASSPVWLALDDAWQQRIQSYPITTGRFTMGGGIAGTSEEFVLKGELAVMREGKVATFQFRLAGTGGTRAHALTDYATGVVESDGKIKINRFSAGSLIAPPNAGLKADGRFTDGNKKLSLNLWSRPSMIADGYGGQGSIEAAVASSTNNP